ncbi:TonB-dependent receptor [Pedobacter sp. SD-b]|uniref:TonB-dependent receptor n=1 Tax=Pedobacter segetis TaxID=2793069 RepID=A0ABS1BJG1_9SPHI|nr:TonB-dependent receptor [Pedobacter segetis]MBK0382481.1 TonB-dependent receptor [Pedobacter segetis]
MKIKYCLFFFSFLLVLTSLNSFAQIDSLQKVEEVKVKSSSKKTSLRATQTIDSASFLKTSSYNVADAIRNFAGVNIKDYGGIGGLKTVSVRSLGANHTGVQVDGINLGDTQTGQIDLGKLMLDNVESISLYLAQPDDLLANARSFSSASLIVIKTKKPLFDLGRTNKLMLKYTGGAFGLVNPVIQYDQKINSNWAFNLNTTLQKATGDYKFKVIGDGSDTLSTRRNAKINALQFDGGLRGKIGKTGLLEVRANYYDSERGLPNAVIFYNPTGSQTLWDKDFYAQAKYSRDFGAKWKILASGKFSRNYTRYNDPDYLNQNGELDNRYTQKEYYQSVATTYQPIKDLTFNYAADLFFTTLYTNLFQYAYPTRTSLLQVVGGKYQLKKFTFEANVLSTYIKEKVKTGRKSPERLIFNPTFSLAYQANQNLTLRAFYKDIFRYPTFNDLYYTNFGNRKLDPEKTKQYNAGFVYNKFTTSKLNWFSISTDVYYNQINDKIIALPNKDLFIWTMYNIGKVEILGVDFTSKFNYQINQKAKIEANINYTYQSALDKTDPTSSVYNNQIPYTPQHTIAFNAGYQQKSWGVFYNQIFSSGRYYLGENQPQYFVKGFSVSDVSINCKTTLYHQPISLSAEVNNIFNQNYSIIRSFPMPGTSLRLTIKTTI